jgi:hypothetical protein
MAVRPNPGCGEYHMRVPGGGIATQSKNKDAILTNDEARHPKIINKELLMF